MSSTNDGDRQARADGRAEARRQAAADRAETIAAERKRKREAREAERVQRAGRQQAASDASALALVTDLAKPARTRPGADRIVHLNASTLWTTGPLAGLGDRACRLWLRLATGPEVTTVPGLTLATSAMIAGSIGWTAEEVERVAASIPASSLRADWRAGVVWLPAIIGYQPPHNYKNVLGWRAVFAALPETPIAEDIHADLRIHCAGRDPAFAVAFAEIPVPRCTPRAEAPATVEINGVHVVVAGLAPEQGEEVVVTLARMLGVSIQVQHQAAIESPAPAHALTLPVFGDYVPAEVPPPAGRRQTKAQRMATEQAQAIAGILAYQDERRDAAFIELAQRAPIPIDRETCAKRIAERMVEGRTVAEMRTAIDRMYERVGDAPSIAERKSLAAWWTAERWQPRAFAETLALEVGAARPAGIGALVKQINAAAPPGAAQIAVLSKEQTRHVEHLVSVGHDDVMILATVIDFAAVVAAQESQLSGRRALQDGEVRLVKQWGPGLFRLPAWLGVQTAVERFKAAGPSLELFLQVSLALQGVQAQQVKSG